jgi:hypothetical protein
MPYVDLIAKDDFASIWYSTNSPFGNVGSFDPQKPSVVILPPWCLDSSWLSEQFGDPRLDSDYNLIAFDMRVSGRSFSRPTGQHDCWVEAADLAFAHQVRPRFSRQIQHTKAPYRHYIFLLATLSLTKDWLQILQ